MTAQEIRKAYLEFFEKRGHKVIPRANLVPQEDATTLFTGSGMQPLVPYLLGEEHPEGKRLADSQTCFRAEDIEEVGDNRHTTFFEMLGNWSLGDYFKAEEIPWLFEFLVDVVRLDPKRLYVTCFIGDEKHGIGKDTEAAELWQRLFQDKGVEAKTIDIGSPDTGYVQGMQGGRIFFYDGSKNWWSRGGSPDTTPVGDPCGPDTEVFYDFGAERKIHENSDFSSRQCHPNCDCGRFFEIANSVFMAYRRTDKGFEPLEKPNVDFGGGLERIAASAIDSDDMFRISLLRPIVEKLEELSGHKYDEHRAAMQVIADHLRAAVWLAADGVTPSNTGQGYVMRRLLRRAIRYGLELGIESDLCIRVGPAVGHLYKDDFPEMHAHHEQIVKVFAKEERVFRQTLRKGVREFGKLSAKGKLSGEAVFLLYDTYGFPAELSLEEAAVNAVTVDGNWRSDFDRLMGEQRERSHTATVGQFKGGLGGHGDIHRKYHTATHLAYKALKMVLGDHVVQRGSNITEERLRFDFSHPEKMTPEQIKRVEDIVNEQIKNDLPVSWQELPTDVALKKGALGAFGDKYGDKVKVYSAGRPGEEPFSFEICGGPHVEHTGELGEGGKKFKITKEESSSAGIRRIKAVLQ
jgi:alanyl-tRNA synthetase